MATFSGELPQGLQKPTVNVNRSWTLGLNKGRQLEEDMANQELMANNDYLRSISLQDHANAFSAQQAEIARRFNAEEALFCIAKTGFKPSFLYSLKRRSTSVLLIRS